MMVAYESFLPSGMPKARTILHWYADGNKTLCGKTLTEEFWICDGFPRESVNCGKCKKLLEGA
jgi:hypothetical protein